MTRKRTLKAMAFAVSALLVLSVCPIANAASISLDDAEYTAASKSIMITGSAANFSGSLTLLVYNKADVLGAEAATILSEDILYIDQYDGSTAGAFVKEVFLRDDVAYAEEVTVALGGTGIASAQRVLVSIGAPEEGDVTVNLGIPAAALAGASVTFVTAGGDEIVLAAGEGGFTGAVPAGAYTVEIARPGYLARSIGVNVDASGNLDKDLSNVELIAGDVNNDGAIDAFDFSDFALVFGKTLEGDPSAYTLSADFNGDGVIDAFDFSDFALGFGKTSATYED